MSSYHLPIDGQTSFTPLPLINQPTQAYMRQSSMSDLFVRQFIFFLKEHYMNQKGNWACIYQNFTQYRGLYLANTSWKNIQEFVSQVIVPFFPQLMICQDATTKQGSQEMEVQEEKGCDQENEEEFMLKENQREYSYINTNRMQQKTRTAGNCQLDEEGYYVGPSKRFHA